MFLQFVDSFHSWCKQDASLYSCCGHRKHDDHWLIEHGLTSPPTQYSLYRRQHTMLTSCLCLSVCC